MTEGKKQNGKYRHELKYKLNYSQYISIKKRLASVMELDKNVGDNGRYIIRSVYFDNIYDKALREKVDGVQKREKFRIRYYNDDFSFIRLEKKIKHNNLCMKCSAPITLEQCRDILTGNAESLKNDPSELVRELYCKMEGLLLRPRVLVSYIREPFVYKPGNVRVTLDYNVRTSMYDNKLFECGVHDISAMDTSVEYILEVKYDAFLPEVISHIVQTDVRQTAFSKYGACRRFG